MTRKMSTLMHNFKDTKQIIRETEDGSWVVQQLSKKKKNQCTVGTEMRRGSKKVAKSETGKSHWRAE